MSNKNMFGDNFENMSDEQLEVISKQVNFAQIQRLDKKIYELFINQGKVEEKLNNGLDVLNAKIDNKITLDYGHQQALLNAKNNRVRKLWNEELIDKNVIDTKGKLHGRIWTDVKNAFGVSSYKDIKAKDFDEAKNYINAWRPRIV